MRDYSTTLTTQYVCLTNQRNPKPCARRYEDAMLLFPAAYQHFPSGTARYPDGTHVYNDGTLWTRVATSRAPITPDGTGYMAGNRTPWIPRGRGTFDNVSRTFHGDWDAGMAFAYQGLVSSRSNASQHRLADPSSCVQANTPVGASRLTVVAWTVACQEWDVLHQYYMGTQGTHHTQSHHFGNTTNGIGRVRLRRDGFASWKSPTGSSPGILTTVPLPMIQSCSNTTTRPVLLINADTTTVATVSIPTSTTRTTAVGSVRVGFIDAESGADVPGFELDKSDPISGNHARAVVSWVGNADLSKLVSASELKLRIELRQASLYAWEWRCI